jgi:hypothetical protein
MGILKLFFTNLLFFYATAGLTLKKLKKNVHGIDLGPMEPCLPERLYTKSGKIEFMKTIYAVLFLALIITPYTLLIGDIHIPKTWIFENRVMTQKPDISKIPFERLAQAYENYFNDNLPLRTQFIANYMKTWEMGLSSFVRENVKGKDGHYFCNSKDGPTVERYLGLDAFSKEQLYRFRTVVAGRQAFWQAMGADYLFLLVPDKITFYPEFLPDWINKHQSWYDQLNQVLENTVINYVDGKRELEKQKVPGKPFFNKFYDILHWNGNALDVMYDVISENMLHIKGFQPLDEKEQAYTIVMRDIPGALFTSETVPWMELNTEGLRVVQHDYAKNKTYPWEGCDIVVNDRAERGTFLFAVDSYFKATHQDPTPGANGAIFPLAHTVHKFIFTHYKEKFSVIQAIAKKEKPDMVVEVSVERAGMNITITSFPRLLIAGEKFLNDAQFIIVPEIFSPSTKKINCSLIPKDNTLTVVAENTDPILYLPTRRANKDGRLAIMVKMSSQVDTVAQIFYAQGNENFHGQRVLTQKIKKGINYLHFSVYARPDEEIRLRFDPGAKAASYTIFPMPNTKEMFEEKL